MQTLGNWFQADSSNRASPTIPDFIKLTPTSNSLIVVLYVPILLLLQVFRFFNSGLMSDIPKIPLEEQELLINQPLPWSVYGPDDELLLNQGEEIGCEHQKYILLTRGVFREATLQEARQINSTERTSLASPFHVLDTIRQNSHRLLLSMLAGKKDPDYRFRILKICKVIQKLCTENRDAVLGAIILDQKSLYTQIHPILCALLTELLLRQKNVPENSRQKVIAAALTQNLGMMELQESLTRQTTVLTEAQKQRIREHPALSRKILQQHGIQDKDWLESVQNHHEKPDGSGYPKGLTQAEIGLYARVLSLADIYSAMVLPRKYRDGFFVKRALREIFLQRGSSVDKTLAELLIQEIGIYPPGAFVTLKNGDTAIVIHRGHSQANQPIVLPVLSAHGEHYSTAQRKQAKPETPYAICQVIPRPDDLSLDLHRIWGLK